MRQLYMLFLFVHGLGTVYGQLIEAESGEKTGTQISTQRSGYSGQGYITGFDSEGDKITVRTYVSRGIYEIYIRYASSSGDKYNYLAVNGQNVGSVSFPLTTTFQETLAGKVYLEKGENTISIIKDWGYVDIDNFRIVASEASPIHNLDASLATATPSLQADSLYNFLSSIYGKVMLTGQYGGSVEFDKILTVSGKVPVVHGFDLMDYSPSRVERGTSSTESEKAIEWHNDKGITTMLWHWNAPKDLIDQPGKEWWRGFYTDATTFDIQIAMSDPNSEEYTLILRDIDAIAVQLLKLKNAGVPVLWRPLHEAEGGWFWWGAKGPEAARWLWKLLFDRLVNHHGLNNLIWVWTSSGSSQALNWYPGDEYVDMIGADIYLPDGTYSSNFVTFDNLASIFGGRKIIALSETGPMPDPESAFIEGATWSWFSTWSGEFITDGIKNTTEHIDNVHNHDFTITLDEIPQLEPIIQALEIRKEELINNGQITGIERYPVVRYNNPVSSTAVISLKDQARVSIIELLDINGKVLTRQTRELTDAVVIDLSEFSTGVYIVRVVTFSSSYMIRLLKI
jgi:mannan endo-1,4-beta-mannosidase